MTKIDWNRPATYEDANLLLRLYEERREEKLRKARAWFVGECKVKTVEEWQALCPLGSENNAQWRMVVSYWEMAASFVTCGVLHPELFIQNSLEHLIVWERVQPVAAALRKMNNSPQYLRNLEAVAGMAREWLDRQGPGVYESFAARFKA
ncbi:MAG: hypothetical protein HZB13_21500 [Acidobacteria bacterium]|nr:hypothetical protein [Acidobacteriota bacterium]